MFFSIIICLVLSISPAPLKIDKYEKPNKTLLNRKNLVHRIQTECSYEFFLSNIKERKTMLFLFIRNECETCIKDGDEFSQASKLPSASKIKFFIINCDSKQEKIPEICLKFTTYKNPEMRVFIKGDETKNIPENFKFETLALYIEKISYDPIVELKSEKNVLTFNQFSESTAIFILIHNTKEDDVFNCYFNLASSINYYPLYYFGYAQQNFFHNEHIQIKPPTIIVTFY
jgi:hypothetical protein